MGILHQVLTVLGGLVQEEGWTGWRCDGRDGVRPVAQNGLWLGGSTAKPRGARGRSAWRGTALADCDRWPCMACPNTV